MYLGYKTFFAILLSKYSLYQNKCNNLSYEPLQRSTHTFEEKINDRCFCWFSKGGQHGVSLQSFINFSIKYNAFPNISPIKYRTDPILGEAFCISLVIFFHFPDSGLSILTGLHLLYY